MNVSLVIKGVFVCLPSLVKVNEENHVVPETGQSVGCWHGDDEGEHIINEGIECLGTVKVTYHSQNYKKKKKF